MTTPRLGCYTALRQLTALAAPAFIALAALVSPASAALVTTYGTPTPSNNCIPFGCPDNYGPHMGFVYRDIAPFNLQAGDVIAFDTTADTFGSGVNDVELSFDLALSGTTSNGSSTPDSSGFTVVSALGSGVFGDSVLGNFDIAFVANTSFSFGGGGLIVDFANTSVSTVDAFGPYNLSGFSSPFSVGRYYNSATPGPQQAGNSFAPVGVIRISTGVVNSVPEPMSLALLGVGLLGLGVVRRRGQRSACNTCQ